MRKICSKGFSFLLLSLLLSLSSCQEFIHNSFDTFTGRIVDVEGNPVAGLELIVTQELDFGPQEPVAKTVIYKVKTDGRGEFRFVLPSRNEYFINSYFFLLLTAPAQFQMEVFGELVTINYISVTDVEKGTDGVRDLGTLKIVRE
uniref:hypothetical protein n=1 Tax=Algoriphagus sp. TaxID=1872435 RepID=UPI004048E9C9